MTKTCTKTQKKAVNTLTKPYQINVFTVLIQIIDGDGGSRTRVQAHCHLNIYAHSYTIY